MKIKQKEGQDKLPSFFETLNTTINRPLESLQKLEELITKDVYTQQNTEGYRIDAKIDRMLAKTRKQRSWHLPFYPIHAHWKKAGRLRMGNLLAHAGL